MVKKSLSHYALAPWGVQPNTSLAAHLPRSLWAVSRLCPSAFSAFYMFDPAHISEMISLIGMHNSTLASCARSHSRILSAHFFIAG